jgi:hypothetical protein
MALQLTKMALSGVTVNNAIHRVMRVCVQSGGSADFTVGMMVDSVITTPVEVLSFTFEANFLGQCIFEQCYNHLKTLPEYAGAIDV